MNGGMEKTIEFLDRQLAAAELSRYWETALSAPAR
jgi:hypothetical protein